MELVHLGKLNKKFGQFQALPNAALLGRPGPAPQMHSRDRRYACMLRLWPDRDLLQREGWHVNVKRVWRLCRTIGLQLCNNSPKRRVQAMLREGRTIATDLNDVWALDFVHDQHFDGRKISVLTMIDAFTRLAPASDVRHSFKGADVVASLEKAVRDVGRPRTIHVDSCPEFTSRDLDLWAFVRGFTLDFSRPGRSTDNAFIESLNGRFRAECLNANWL